MNDSLKSALTTPLGPDSNWDGNGWCRPLPSWLILKSGHLLNLREVNCKFWISHRTIFCEALLANIILFARNELPANFYAGAFFEVGNRIEQRRVYGNKRFICDVGNSIIPSPNFNRSSLQFDCDVGTAIGNSSHVSQCPNPAVELQSCKQLLKFLFAGNSDSRFLEFVWGC